MKYNALLQQYQRNGTDDYPGRDRLEACARQPSSASRKQVNHYKADSFFTLDPNGFLVQEADGTPPTWATGTSQTPYGIAACNYHQHGQRHTPARSIYTHPLAANPTGGMPIINPACAVVTSYMRSQPTRILDADRDASLAEQRPQELHHERRCSLHLGYDRICPTTTRTPGPERLQFAQSSWTVATLRRSARSWQPTSASSGRRLKRSALPIRSTTPAIQEPGSLDRSVRSHI